MIAADDVLDAVLNHVGMHVKFLDILHGSFAGKNEYGGDSRVQAALDLLGIPYTGSGYLSSAIAMDKIASKEMMGAHGIPTPAWQVLEYEEADVERLFFTKLVQDGIHVKIESNRKEGN